MKYLLTALALVVLGLGGWYYYNGGLPMAPSQEGSPSDAAGGTSLAGSEDAGRNDTPGTPMADGAEGSVIGSNLALGVDNTGKPHLIAYNGMTLYTYTKDTGKESTCYDQCAVNWPPYLVGAEDNVHQVKAGVVGEVDTIIRTDGGIQVTYNGHPLYFYIGDKESSDMTGEGKGGVWYVVKP